MKQNNMIFTHDTGTPYLWKLCTHKTWTPNLDPQSGPQSGPPYGPPSNGVNSFERSNVNIRIDFSWNIWTTRGFVLFFFYSTELTYKDENQPSPNKKKVEFFVLSLYPAPS